MMKKQKWLAVIVICIGILFLNGCMEKKEVPSKYKIYHLNVEQTGLVEEPYYGETEDIKKAIQGMLECLEPVLPESVKLLRFTLNDEKVMLYFNKSYRKMSTEQEVLCRAAIVRTLTQLNGVDLVAFNVDGDPLRRKDGTPYGYLQSEDFVQNTGSSINSFEETEMTLYFADKTGKKLVEEVRMVQYNSNLALEKVIIDQLMRGPTEEGLQATIPKGTKLLSTFLKDGICYLNFDEGLQQPAPGVTPEVIIYSIVNSVLESDAVASVQISIDGESKLTYQESVKLGEPLERKQKLLEE